MSSHLGIREVFKGKDPIIEYALKLLPFTLLLRPNFKLSIVAVHGLNGGSVKTWTTKETGKFWLSDPDMLPYYLKNARILAFGYDASVTSLFGRTSSDRILQHAQTLIAELVADRQLEGVLTRPIIFICHSLGGIIVKRALAYSASRTSEELQQLHSVFMSTYGILFLGTPHDGSNKADLASTAQKIINALMPSKLLDTDGQLLKALHEESEVLQNITAQFAPLMSNFRIYFFWEQEKTDLGATRKYIVKEDSAAPILDNTERAGLPYDHRNMCRFESRNAPGFRVVVAALVMYTSNAPSAIARRWLFNAQMLQAKQVAKAVEELVQKGPPSSPGRDVA